MPGLRPLGFGEILDVGIKLVPAELASADPVRGRPRAARADRLRPAAALRIARSARPDRDRRPDLESEDASALLAAQGVSALLQGIVYVIATAACFKAVSDAYLGSTPSAGRSLRFAVRALPRLCCSARLRAVRRRRGRRLRPARPDQPDRARDRHRRGDRPGDLPQRGVDADRAGAAVRARQPVRGARALLPARQGPLVVDLRDPHRGRDAGELHRRHPPGGHPDRRRPCWPTATRPCSRSRPWWRARSAAR